MLVLSLFPGIGLLDRAFEAEGFAVVRGPDVLWGGDIRKFHPPAGRFDGIIGGPPCQEFDRLAHMVRQNGYQPKFGNLIPEFERCVDEAAPDWFLMENVEAAPIPAVEGYGVHSFLLDNRQCFDEAGQPATQSRVRRWSFGWRGERRVLMVETSALRNPVYEHVATGGGRGVPVAMCHGPGGAIVSARSRRPDGTATTMPFNAKTEAGFAEVRRKQGLPDDFDLPSFTVVAKCKAVGNGVPLPMGRALAAAVMEALQC